MNHETGVDDARYGEWMGSVAPDHVHFKAVSGAMNRAFVNEDNDAGVVFIPPRAPLPPGVRNYVTPRGIRLLREEMKSLESERDQVNSGPRIAERDKVRLLTINRGRISDLKNRIATAVVLDPPPGGPDSVRFGTTVDLDGKHPRTLTIVGVDEADAGSGRIAFVAPVARALTGKSVGDEVVLPSPDGPSTHLIRGIRYQSE